MCKQASFSPQSRLRAADVTQSVCPYSAVGCGLLVFTKPGRSLISIVIRQIQAMDAESASTLLFSTLSLIVTVPITIAISR